MKQTALAHAKHASLILCLISVLFHTGVSAQPTPIYRNDFANRASEGPLAAKTYTIPYVAGLLCAPDYATAYANPAWIQDGWVEGINSCDLFARVKDAGGNPLACLCRTDPGKYLYVRHPIGNLLSNGSVRLAGDIHPPSQWSGSSRNISLHLGTDRFMSLLDADREEYYRYQTCLLGFRSANNTDTSFSFFAYQGNGDGSAGTMVSGTAPVDTSHWYRFVATLDLAANTYTAAVHDMGADQPTLNTPDPAAPVETFGGATFRFRMDLTNATSGISALGLSAYGVSGGDTGDTNINLTARFDNLTLDHTPSGATSSTRVYANDFATRSYIRLVPGSLAFTYDSDRSGPNGTFTYATGDALVRDNLLEFPNGSILGSAADGWIRRNSGAAGLTVETDGNPHARAWHANGTTFVTACQRIGNTLTNGMLQVTADITPPDKWYWTVSRSLGILVGDDALYRGEKDDANQNSYYHHYSARFGFSGTSNTDIRFQFYDGNSANSATGVYGTATVNPTNWYRFVATLNLTNATYSVNVYDLGAQHSISSNATPDMLVQTFSGGFRRRIGANPLTELQGVSALCLAAYGAAGGYTGTNNPAATAGFDNLLLTATLPEQAPVEIYRNLFTTRTYTNITGSARSAPLTGVIDMLGGGQDDWVRRNNGNSMSADLSAAGGNPQLRISHTGYDHIYCMQPLGTDVTRNILCAQFDIRPPAYWVWSYHSASLYLGDDRFWQGNRNATQNFNKYYALNFGFGSTNEWADGWGVYPNVSVFASDGDGNGNVSNLYATASIVKTNWYRFQADISPFANTYSLKVFNMGSTQPTLETPTPTSPVATLAGLKFKTKLRKPGDPDTRLEALSSMSLAGFGIRGGQLFPPEECVLIDNLLFTIKRTGTLLRIH